MLNFSFSLLNPFRIAFSLFSTQDPRMSSAQVALVAPVIDHLAGTPLGGLSHELTEAQLIQACLESREIGAKVSCARSMGRALSALGERVKGADEAGLVVSRAARAAREEPESADLATRLEAIAEQARELEALRGSDGDLMEAEFLVIAEAQAEALEASMRAQLEGHRDEIVAGLRGVWGTEGAHEGLVKVLINGEESVLSTLARNAKIFELGSCGSLSVDGREETRYAVSFVVPTRLAAKGSVGPNAFVFEWADGGWELMTGSVVGKNSDATVGLYRLVGQEVNERAEIKAHIRTLMLEALEASASPASALHAVISEGSYKFVLLVHKLKHRAAGLAMYQLALVADADSMSGSSAELAETMTTIKANMTAGSKVGEAPRYFTIGVKRAGGRCAADEETADSQRDEQDGPDEPAAVGRMMSVAVSASSGRKRKSIESVESVESAESVGSVESMSKSIDEAVAKAMETGRAGLDENEGDDTRIALFLKGAERINGPGGLEEQIQAKVKALGGWKLSVSGDDLAGSAACLSRELSELEEKKGNLRVAMQEATARVEASKVHSALVRAKRQRS